MTGRVYTADGIMQKSMVVHNGRAGVCDKFRCPTNGKGIGVEAWLNTPLIVMAAIAVASLIFYAGKWYQAVNSDRESFKVFMSEVKGTLNSINDKLHEIFSRLPPVPLTSRSPIQLTDLGEAISRELDGKQWARNASTALLERYRPLSAYEIQERCFRYAKRQSSLAEDMPEKVQDSAYKHGLHKEKVLEVLGVELRDHILTRLGRTEELP